MASLYIYHFEKPYWKTCIHYIGYTTRTVEVREKEHRALRGSKLVAYALKKGIGFEISYRKDDMTKDEARSFELEVKRKPYLVKKLCSVCSEHKKI